MYPKASSCEEHGCLDDHDPVDCAEDIVESVVLPKYQLECRTNARTSILSTVSWVSRSPAESWHSGKTPSSASAEDLERAGKTWLTAATWLDAQAPVGLANSPAALAFQYPQHPIQSWSTCCPLGPASLHTISKLSLCLRVKNQTAVPIAVVARQARTMRMFSAVRWTVGLPGFRVMRNAGTE